MMKKSIGADELFGAVFKQKSLPVDDWQAFDALCYRYLPCGRDLNFPSECFVIGYLTAACNCNSPNQSLFL
jgi:hypothetical protein